MEEEYPLHLLHQLEDQAEEIRRLREVIIEYDAVAVKLIAAFCRMALDEASYFSQPPSVYDFNTARHKLTQVLEKGGTK